MQRRVRATRIQPGRADFKGAEAPWSSRCRHPDQPAELAGRRLGTRMALFFGRFCIARLTEVDDDTPFADRFAKELCQILLPVWEGRSAAGRARGYRRCPAFANERAISLLIFVGLPPTHSVGG